MSPAGLVLILMLSGSPANDSSRTERPAFDTSHSPKKAMLLSLCLPGAGQIYNRKFWKLPLVYGGVGTSAWFFFDNNSQYKKHRTEYLFRLNNNGAANDADLTLYSEGQLRTLTDQYRRWRDLSVVAFAAFYALQVVDATVDAYLWRHDTSRDLSYFIRPSFIGATGGMAGLRIGFKF